MCVKLLLLHATNLDLFVIASATILVVPIYSNLISSYTILRVHNIEKDYVHTVLTNNALVQDYFTGYIYSLPVGSERTNPISDNSHPSDPSSSTFHSWLLPTTSI